MEGRKNESTRPYFQPPSSWREQTGSCHFKIEYGKIKAKADNKAGYSILDTGYQKAHNAIK
jgi:hypothetical protein